MSGLCGWIGPLAGGVDPGAALAGMAAGLAPLAPQTAWAAARPDAALHVDGCAPADGLAIDGDVIAGLTGYPRWTDPDIAALAADKGHGAALIEAYRRWGAALLDRLRDQFALALLDRASGDALLAIDRAGIGTLCYAATDDGGLAFGTTTDAVRAHPGVTSTLSRQAVFDFLYLYRVPAPGTIYQEQAKLLPGHLWERRGGAVTTRPYWQMPYGAPTAAGRAEMARDLLAVLRAAYGRIAASEPEDRLAAFLSGGVDSSTVTGLYAEASAAPARSFTIGFDLPRYDESGYARIVADYYGTQHREYFVQPDDVAAAFVDLATGFDEPFGNSSVVPAYYCAKTAREAGVAVMLAGDGGDELFGGNARYVTMERLERYNLLPRWLRRGVIEPVLFGAPWADRIGPWRKVRNLVDWCRTPMPARLERYEYMASARWQEMFADGFLDAVDTHQPLALQREAYHRPDHATMLQRMMALDLQITLADTDLRKVVRACELAGTRVRFPLLDDAVLDFAAALPSGWINRGGRLRAFFKDALKGFLPDEVLTKKKHGFGLPSTEWIKDPGLREICTGAIDSLAGRGLMRQAFIESLRKALATKAETPLDTMLWDASVLALWLDSRDGGGYKTKGRAAVVVQTL